MDIRRGRLPACGPPPCTSAPDWRRCVSTSITSAWTCGPKSCQVVKDRSPLRGIGLGRRDSNPREPGQSRISYRWMTPQYCIRPTCRRSHSCWYPLAWSPSWVRRESNSTLPGKSRMLRLGATNPSCGRHGNRTRLSQIKSLLRHLDANLPGHNPGLASCFNLVGSTDDLLSWWARVESNHLDTRPSRLQRDASPRTLVRTHEFCLAFGGLFQGPETAKAALGFPRRLSFQSALPPFTAPPPDLQTWRWG
jgi:hypothetical protein